jgi:hypothetical protein
MLTHKTFSRRSTLTTFPQQRVTTYWPRATKFGPTSAPGSGTHIESLLVTAACAIVIYVMCKPAFDSFFYGEDFNAWTMYIAADQNFLKAIFTPFNTFLRPTAYAGIIGTQLILPWDPFIHHWRNFLVLILCIWILYRIMVRMTDWMPARVIAISFFAASKLNFTTIGLINLIELLTTVTYALCTFLFLIRYFQSKRNIDYWIAVSFFALCAFARDSNVMFFCVVVAMFALNAWELRSRGETVHLQTMFRLLPFVILLCAYFIVRSSLGVAMPPIGGDHPYALNFDAHHIFSRLYFFLGNFGNLSFDERGVTGYGDVATFLKFPGGIRDAYYGALTVAVLLACAVALASSLRSDLSAMVPLIWAGALLFPTLLIGNRQPYYAFEPIMALSLCIAVSLDRAGPVRARLVPIWLVLLAIIAANGLIANRFSGPVNYTWQYVTHLVERVNQQIIIPHRGEPVTELVIVTPDDSQSVELVGYILNPLASMVAAKEKVPMLNALLWPTLKRVRAVPFAKFSLDEVLKTPRPWLVYRQDPTRENYTNITLRTVWVAAVDSNGGSEPDHGPDKLFDKPTSRVGGTTWISTNTEGPHIVTFRFSDPTRLGSLRIINSPRARVQSMEIQLLVAGKWIAVFDQDNLQERSVIDARWPDKDAMAVQVIVKRSMRDGQPSSIAEIEEIEFPENKRDSVPAELSVSKSQMQFEGTGSVSEALPGVAFEVVPNTLRVCDPPRVAKVSWDAIAVGVSAVKIFVSKEGEEEKLFVHQEAIGNADTGPWVTPKLVFILKDEEGTKQLAKFVVGSERCF